MSSRLVSNWIYPTGRTIIVGKNSVDYSFRLLENVMVNLGIIKHLHRKRYYEKPTKKRERMEYEKCLRVYNREMKKKVHFVMKQHKPLPPI
jgi:small subunit ribosomal protein S21